MHQLVKRFAREEDGATAIEYGLILALIFLGIIAAVKGVAGEAISMFEYVTEKVVEAVSG